MSKAQSRAQLVIASIEIFAAQTVASLFATVDGQFFINENRAKLHNKTIKGGKVYEIERHEAEEANVSEVAPKTEKTTQPKNEVLQGSNKEVAASVLEIDDVAVLDALLAEENETQKRKGAIKSIEARIEALTVGNTVDATKASNEEE